MIFCTLMMVTGPIWAKGTWGHWWSWDPRLTLTLLLWFVYASYLLLRGFTEGAARTARFAAIYGMLGTLLIPLNYFVIELFQGRAVHPDNLARGSLGAGMGLPFLLGNLTLFAAFAYCVLLRWEVEMRRARLALRADALAEGRCVSYAIAAYGITGLTLGCYLWLLHRERRRLDGRGPLTSLSGTRPLGRYERACPDRSLAPTTPARFSSGSSRRSGGSRGSRRPCSRCPREELDQGIREQLGVAAELAGVERTRLVVANPKTGRVAAAYDWWSPTERNVPPIEADFFQRFAWAREQIQRGDVVQMSPDSLPREASRRASSGSRSQGVRSVLVIPVRFSKAIVGGHIFVSRTQERFWSEQEIANLRVVTEIFASAVRRRQAEHALRESEAALPRDRRARDRARLRVRPRRPLPLREPELHAAPRIRIRRRCSGSTPSTLVHPDDLDEVDARRRAAASSAASRCASAHRMRHRDGSWRWFESSGGVYRTPNGSPRFVCIGRHVSERVAMEEAMARQLAAEQAGRGALAPLPGACRRRSSTARSARRSPRPARSAAPSASCSTRRRSSPDAPLRFFYEWCAPGIASFAGVRCPWSEARLAEGRVLHFGSHRASCRPRRRTSARQLGAPRRALDAGDPDPARERAGRPDRLRDPDATSGAGPTRRSRCSG